MANELIEKIREYLDTHNIEYKLISSSNRIRLRCLNPDHVDTNPSMIIYQDGHYYCFGCGMHGKVSDLFKIKYKLPDKFDMLKPVKKINIDNNIKIKEIKMPSDLKDINVPVRGISIETLRKFRVKLTKSGNIFIPILFDGKPVGYAIRYPHSWIFSKEKTINEMHFSQYLYPFSIRAKTVAIVEGLFDMLKMWDWGFPAFCSFGTHWTRTKTLTLLRNCPQRIILMFDNDNAGQKIQNELTRRFKNSFEVIPLNIDKDPDEWLELPRNIRKLLKLFKGG